MKHFGGTMAYKNFGTIRRNKIICSDNHKEFRWKN